jgi:hypothetical protein
MRSTRTTLLWPVLLAALLVTGAVPQGQSVPAVPSSSPAVPPPLPSGPAPDLDLVFTAEVAGYVEPCG